MVVAVDELFAVPRQRVDGPGEAIGRGKHDFGGAEFAANDGIPVRNWARLVSETVPSGGA
jgi:hypothetical protein